MRFLDLLSVNTYDKAALPAARELGLGLEIEEYLWPCTEEEAARKKERVSAWMTGLSRFSFHGTAVSRDADAISGMPDGALLSLYDTSYRQARAHGADRLVFHSNYLAALQTPAAWLRAQAGFWKTFLTDKPPSLRVYIENFIDDTPELLARLCDETGDPRLRLCLDTGHAGCNSRVPLAEWIAVLGRRVGHVHLHDNDGLADRHWPLGRGALPLAEAVEALLAHSAADTYVLECGLAESLVWLRENGFLELPAWR